MDLRDPQNAGKSRNTRFIDRVFTPDEQKLIHEASNPDAILWALWAGKETAYKVISKNDPSATSVPRQYKVSLDSAGCFAVSSDASVESSVVTGCVDTPYGKVHIKIFITCDYVHCVGATAPLEATDAVDWHIDRINPDAATAPDYESSLVRKSLVKRLSICLNQDEDNIEIRREKGANGLGAPFVYLRGRRTGTDISLSHDGLFTAYAYSLPSASH